MTLSVLVGIALLAERRWTGRENKKKEGMTVCEWENCFSCSPFLQTHASWLNFQVQVHSCREHCKSVVGSRHDDDAELIGWERGLCVDGRDGTKGKAESDAVFACMSFSFSPCLSTLRSIRRQVTHSSHPPKMTSQMRQKSRKRE